MRPWPYRSITVLGTVEACGKGAPNRLRSSVPETGKASPAQTCAALRDGGCRALVYIFDPSPQLRGSHVEDLNCDLLLREFCAALLFERLADVLRPPGLAFLASPPSNGSQNQSHELE